MKGIGGWVCVLAVLGLVGSTAVEAAYDSNGFEGPTFVLGPLAGQDGWTASAANGGVAPMVVTAPDPVIGQQAVRLEVPDVQGANSIMDHAIPAINNVAGWIVTVSYDIYRDAPAPGKLAQNLWWWWWDTGEPTYGLQWDQAGGLTLPHGWNPGAGSTATVYGRYANVKMVWDFQQMKAYSWYDGAVVDNGIPITNVTKLTGWSIYLSHDAGDGTGGSVVWIDNFSITAIPEPVSLTLLGLGGLLAVRRRK